MHSPFSYLKPHETFASHNNFDSLNGSAADFDVPYETHVISVQDSHGAPVAASKIAPETSEKRLRKISSGSFDSLLDAPSSKHAKKPTFWRRYRCCLIVSLLLLVILIVGGIVAYVKLPQLAQTFMDGSHISFTSIKMVAPSENGFTAHINGAVTDAGPFSATTAPMHLTISYLDRSIGSMVMPAMSLNFGTAQIDLATNFTILDKQAFTLFSKALLKDAAFTWRLNGVTDLKVMNVAVPGLIFDKQVTLSGMKGFPAVTVKDFNLFSVAAPSSAPRIDMTITTQLINDSPISMEVGDMFLLMQYQGRQIGFAKGSNVTINSGLNTLSLKGSLQAGNYTDTSHFSSLFSNYVGGVDSAITVLGTGGQGGGGVSWLNAAMSDLRLNIDLPAPSSLKMINKISIDGMSIAVNPQAQLQPTLSVKKISVDFKMPFDFPIRIMGMKQTIWTYNGDTVIGVASTPFVAASNAANPGVIVSSMPPVPMSIPKESADSFSSFLTGMFMATDSSLKMKGSADVQASTPVGLITLTGVKFEQVVPMQGMQSLLALDQKLVSIQSAGGPLATNPVLNKVTVLKGLKDMILMQTDLMLYSASSVSMNMGDVKLMVAYKDQQVGYSILRNLTVAPGENHIVCETYYSPQTPEQKTAGSEMVSNYINGIPSQVVMTGTLDRSTPIGILQQSLSHLRLVSYLPPLANRVVQSAAMNINPLTVPFTNKAKTSFFAANPFGDKFVMDTMKATIQLNGTELATMDVTGAPLPFEIGAMQSTQTPTMEVHMDNPLSLKSLGALRKGMSHHLFVDVDSEIMTRVGDYFMLVHYKQSSLPTTIALF